MATLGARLCEAARRTSSTWAGESVTEIGRGRFVHAGDRARCRRLSVDGVSESPAKYCACNRVDYGQHSVTHFPEPGRPWAYSASPAMAVLRWRYAETSLAAGDDWARRVSAALHRRWLHTYRMSLPIPVSAATGCSRPEAPSSRDGRRSARSVGGVSDSPKHPGGGGDHGPEQRAARPRGDRAGADRLLGAGVVRRRAVGDGALRQAA